ncbi:MAG TPA: chromate efflux transporter [Thermoanaerobaculia bacterium]|nr:chromate efflux transporter [Thermoanaerobaculia bacterium]
MPATRARLKELAGLFLKLGFTAFGGPAVHVAMMEHEVVGRRRWMSREAFLDLLGATNLMPGPISTKMSLFIGHARAGLAGLLVAGLSFVLPASAIVLAFAWAYVRFGALPAMPHFFEGIKPVVLALVATALVSLGRTALKTRFHLVLGAAALAAAFLVHEFLLLLLAGCVSLAAMAFGDFLRRVRGAGSQPPPEPHGGAAATAPPAPAALASTAGAKPHSPSKNSSSSLSFFSPLLFSSAAISSSFSLSGLFFFFLKTGAILFGSGYVLLAFLKNDLVERWHWLTSAQLLDAVAVGQFTPGPLSSTATFIGYVLAGPAGAAVATAGIFLPAFAFVALCGPIVPRLRASRPVGRFLDGVNVGALALMAAVTLQLARSALVNVPTAALFLASAAVLTVFRINAAWLVLAGGLLGIAFG